MKTARLVTFLAAAGLAAAAIAPAQAADRNVVVRSSNVFIAAERGDPRAQTQIGFMHETGRGLPQDYMLAAAWYQRAARQGYPRAQYLLALLYNNGQGVAEDYVTAHMWFNLAAAGASAGEREQYLKLRNSVAFKMTVAQVTEAQWRARHWRPTP
jgi:TPR repeat protein